MDLLAATPEVIEASIPASIPALGALADDAVPDEQPPAGAVDEQPEPWPGNPAVPERLRDDHQFDVAYQTARAWLESNPSSPTHKP